MVMGVKDLLEQIEPNPTAGFEDATDVAMASGKRVGRAWGDGVGEGPVLCQASSPPVPCPGRAPRKPVPAVGPVGAGGEASGPTPSVHRAVRLLRGFTKSTLSNKTPLPAAPPPRGNPHAVGSPGKKSFPQVKTTELQLEMKTFLKVVLQVEPKTNIFLL